MRRLLIVLTLLLCLHAIAPVAGQIEPWGGTSAYVADLAQRRQRLMASLDPDTVLVLWSAPPRVYSTDTNYEYRQESNLLYLTGVRTEPVTLVLVPGAQGPKEFLFVPARDPFRELWYGRIAPVEEMAAATGITSVFAQRRTEAFDAFVQGLFGLPAVEPASAAVAPARAAGAAAGLAANGRVTMAMLEAPPDAGDASVSVVDAAADPDHARHFAWARRLAATGRPITFRSVDDLIVRQRQVKTAYEQQVMRRSVEISAEAHVEGMKATRPGRWEYEVEAAIEYWFLRNGALSWGYPSIVASGPNATVLHYLESTRRMRRGDLLLVDAAGSFQGLTGDITRTYPVSGRFTAEQRTLYELVLRAEEAGIAAAKPGGTVADVTRAARAVMGEGLLRLGLITDAGAASGESAQIDLWFPHSPVHGIGIDVHEPVDSLVPGVTFVVEPGVYIRPDVLERLRQNPAQAELVRTIEPAVRRFSGIGIRIEDSILMTTSGPEVMSAKAPKRVRDVERLVGSGR